MRLGVLTRNYPPMHGGMSRHAQGIVEAIAKHVDVAVFAPDWAQSKPGGQPVRSVLDKNVNENRKIVANTSVDVWLGLSANFAPLVTTVETPFVLYFHGNDFLNPIFDPGKSLQSRIGRIPLIWRAHKYISAPFHSSTMRKRRAVLEKCARQSRMILFNSSYTRDLARRRYDFGNVPLEILHPGCDDCFFQKHDPPQDGPLRLLTVSNLSSSNTRKNIDGVLEAIGLLGDEFPVLYTVIGGGDDLARLRNRAESLGIGDFVQFEGSVSDEQLLAAYRKHDVLVMASKASEIDVEGFGMVYIEANASGLPVLASAKGGATDAVVDGKTGHIIPDSSAKAIADGIRKLGAQISSFEERDLRAHADQFRWCQIGIRLNDLLRSIV